MRLGIALIAGSLSLLPLAGCGGQTQTVAVKMDTATPSTTTSTTSTVAPDYNGTAPVKNIGPPTDQTGCEQPVTVGAHTSCPFAEKVFGIVRTAYGAAGQIPAHVTAYSAVTKRSYRLACDVVDYGGEVACSTPDGALVVFPKSAATGAGSSATTETTSVAESGTYEPTPNCPAGEGQGVSPSVRDTCWPNPNDCIPKTTGQTSERSFHCPSDEITRAQAVYNQACFGASQNGSVSWTPECSGEGAISTYGLPCEVLVSDGSNDIYQGDFTAFYAGAKHAYYAPNSTSAFSDWTPACYVR